MLLTAEHIITDRLTDLESEIGTTARTGQDIHEAFNDAIKDLIEAFGWHPISRADEFGLRTVPAGKSDGPRIIAMVHGDNQKGPAPYVVYWSADTLQPDGKPVARPKPYWRTLTMSAGWSRRNQPTHFIKPYAPDFSR